MFKKSLRQCFGISYLQGTGGINPVKFNQTLIENPLWETFPIASFSLHPLPTPKGCLSAQADLYLSLVAAQHCVLWRQRVTLREQSQVDFS